MYLQCEGISGRHGVSALHLIKKKTAIKAKNTGLLRDCPAEPPPAQIETLRVPVSTIPCFTLSGPDLPLVPGWASEFHLESALCHVMPAPVTHRTQ